MAAGISLGCGLFLIKGEQGVPGGDVCGEQAVLLHCVKLRNVGRQEQAADPAASSVCPAAELDLAWRETLPAGERWKKSSEDGSRWP